MKQIKKLAKLVGQLNKLLTKIIELLILAYILVNIIK
jgi:hypothetical protein